ncbi:hypothetical protein [Streptomyces spongiae]|nr:hypothetical protein [Streptomyces spongiae]
MEPFSLQSPEHVERSHALISASVIDRLGRAAAQSARTELCDLVQHLWF